MTYCFPGPNESAAIDAWSNTLAIEVARYIGKDQELPDVHADAKRIAHTITQHGNIRSRYGVSAEDVRAVAEDALYFAEHGKLP